MPSTRGRVQRCAMITARTWCSRSRNQRVTPRNRTPATSGAQHAEQRDEHRGRDDECDKRERMPAQIGFGDLVGRLGLADGFAVRRERISRTAGEHHDRDRREAEDPREEPRTDPARGVRHSMPIAISV